MAAFQDASNQKAPDYTYTDKFKNPSEINISDWPDISQMTPNIEGVLCYVNQLTKADDPKCQKYGGDVLGPKFFLKTAGLCKKVKEGGYTDGEEIPKVDRYTYIDNQIKSTIPGLDIKGFGDGKGLMVGMIGDAFKLNPAGLFKAFLEVPEPWCREYTGGTVDNEHNKADETHFVALVDIPEEHQTEEDKKMIKAEQDSHANGEGFTNIEKLKKNFKKVLERDNIPSTYILTVGILFIFILYRIMQKK